MLTIIQIIAILQGLLVGFVLLQKRHEYKNPLFGLFMACIASVVLFAIGDDDYNLLVDNSNWFFFHETLMITFFFLFIRYRDAERTEFDTFDIIFFLPYVCNVAAEALLQTDHFKDNLILKIGAEIIELCFIGMLLYTIYDILKHKKEKWLLAFMAPFAVIFTIDEVSFLISNSKRSILPLDSYGIFLITAILFYFVTYKLILTPKDLLPSSNNKYKLSSLPKSEVESVKRELNRLMREEKLFKNQKLSATEVAKHIGISRQQMSEVLNVHMGVRFQDFLNQHRVEEFIKCLDQDSYKNYTLVGIATEVGFSSKSSFYSTFKKIKGVTPNQYKKNKM